MIRPDGEPPKNSPAPKVDGEFALPAAAQIRAEGAKRHGWLKLLPLATGCLILGTVIIVGLHLGEARRVLELARKSSPAWLAVGAGLQVLTYLCGTGVWRATLRRAGSSLPLWEMVPLGVAKLFTDQAIPAGGVSGAAVVVRGLARRNVPSSVAMTALLIGLVTYYTAYLFVAAAALVVLSLHHRDSPAILIGAVVFAGYAVGAPAIMIWLAYGRRELPSWVQRLPGIRHVLEAAKEAPINLLKDPKLIAEAIALQSGVFLLDAATLWVMFQAIGYTIEPWIAFVGFMMASITATMAPVPLGLGTFEAGAVGFLRFLGVPIAEGLAATLLLRGFTFWLPMLPGLWFARRELSWSRLRKRNQPAG